LVEGQLESGGGADSSDLQQLKSDLSELISLTEGEQTGSQMVMISVVFHPCAATIIINLPLASYVCLLQIVCWRSRNRSCY